LDELHRALYASGRRVAKSEVLDLPPVSYTDVPVVLSKPHKALYDKLVNELLLELPDDVMLDFTQAGKLYQATQRMLFSPETVARTAIKDNAMLATLDELIETLADKKIMIGAWYQETVRLLLEHLKAHNPVALYGGNTPAQTEAAKQRFVNDPACRIAITNFKSGGVGVDSLQNVCSNAIMAEMIAVPGLFQQWVSRLDRSGQKEPVTVYLMVPKATVAVKIRQSLLKKEEVANDVIMDKKQLLKDLLGG
jgi:SNF2 family DNA or RNA helicase